MGENHEGSRNQDTRENERNPKDPTPANKVSEDAPEYQAQTAAHVITFSWSFGSISNMKPMDPDAPQRPNAVAFRAGVGK